MTQSQIFIKAHEETKKIKKDYPEINYSMQFGLCLSQLQTKNMNEYTGQGSEKQIKWAKDILEKKEIIKAATVAKKITYEESSYIENERFERDYQNINNMLTWILQKPAKWIIENRYDINMDELKKIFMDEKEIKKFSYRIIIQVNKKMREIYGENY